MQAQMNGSGGGKAKVAKPMHRRIADWAKRVWRPSATVVAVGLALLLGWHVVNGKHGLSVWQQKRIEDRQLRKEIDELQQENARLKSHVERLTTDPEAIAHEARETLRYVKDNEVIVPLPEKPKIQAQPVGAGK